MRLRAVRGVERLKGRSLPKDWHSVLTRDQGQSLGDLGGGGSSPNASDFSQAPQATPPEHREAGSYPRKSAGAMLRKIATPAPGEGRLLLWRHANI